MPIPRLQNLTLFLICIFLIFAGLFFAKGILIPMAFAMLLAMLLLPLCNKLERRLPRWLAVLSCIVICILVLSGLATLFSFQIVKFADELPRYKSAIYNKIHLLQDFVNSKFDVSQEDQTAYIKNKVNYIVDNSGANVKKALTAATGLVGDLVLVVIFTFLFLYMRDRLKTFMLSVTREERKAKVKMIMSRSGKITGKYLSGVFIVACILSIINSVGLLIIGLDHAIFFGIMVGMCNIIPYVGVPLSAILPVSMAILTKDSYMAPIGVASVFAIGQLIDNYFLTPNIVGDKVNLNPLAIIIGLLIGAAVWGVAGMIIFIPLLAVIKIILDNSEDLHPYAYLIGIDNKPKRKSFIACFIVKILKSAGSFLKRK
jgi:predicted PurR-regulated permease PerM